MLKREVLNPRALTEEPGRAEEQDACRPTSCSAANAASKS